MTLLELQQVLEPNTELTLWEQKMSSHGDDRYYIGKSDKNFLGLSHYLNYNVVSVFPDWNELRLIIIVTEN